MCITRLFYILILALPLGAIAQQQRYLYYDLSEAVASEVIKGIVKDERGLVWFATDQGVLSYDGNRTQLYNKGLQSNYTKTFLSTTSGQLVVVNDFGMREIIRTQDTVYFAPLNLEGYTFDEPLGYPKSLFQDQRGNIWIGEVDGIVRINADGFKRFELGPDFQSISYHRTFTFQEDAFGTLWIAPYKGPLLRYAPETDELLRVEVDIPVTDVTGFAVLRGDYLVLGGKEGIFQIKTDSEFNILETSFIGAVDNISALIVQKNQVYIGTWDDGLHVIEFGQSTPVKVKEVDFVDVVDFFHDPKADEIWVVGSENVGLISFSEISSLSTIGSFRIEAATFDASETLYYSIGQEVRTTKFGDQQAPSTLINSKTNYFDRLLAEGDRLWIGDSFGGIYYYDLPQKTLTKVKDSTGVAIKYIYMDQSGAKWFSGDPEQVIRVDASTDEISYYELPGSIVFGQSGATTLFCGTNNGLYEFQPNTNSFSKINFPSNFTPTGSLAIEDICFDLQDNMWIATNQGLLLKPANEDRLIRRELPGIPVDEPYKAIAWKDGLVWLANDYGLTAYNGENAILYTTKNGLPSKILTWRGLKTYDDGVFVSTAKGAALINSELVKFEQTPVPSLKSILSGGKPVTKNKNGVSAIPYKGNLQAEFVTLTYPGLDIRYQSRVLGLDEQWSDPSDNRQVNFLGFSEGDYTLEVRARETGLLWSEPIQYPFHVEVPWFKTWWAYLIFTGGVALILIFSTRAYNYHLILQKRRFKKIIDERTQEIKRQKNEIIEQKNRIIQQKEELLSKNESIHKSKQALSEADVNFLHLKEKQLQDQIEYRNKQITTHTLHIIQKNETLKELRNKLDAIAKSSQKSPHQEIKKTIKIIDESFRLDKDWEDFKLYFEQIYTGFYTKLKVNCPALTTQELRHCALIRLNLSLQECATILGISPDSVKVSRSRIRKKLELEKGQGLTDFILSI